MRKLNNIKLVRVRYMPKALEPGWLYVSEEFGSAVHLCACGCGVKVSTPLRPTEWTLEETERGPTLDPSIGNWQYPCKSHYWIRDGKVVWAEQWTADQVTAGRRAEEIRRRAYYDSLDHEQLGILKTIWRWIKSLFGR